MTATVPRLDLDHARIPPVQTQIIWIVGVADEKTLQVPEQVCGGWALVGLYESRAKAYQNCFTPRHFLVPCRMNGNPRSVETIAGWVWDQIEYPKWNGPVNEIPLRVRRIND